MTRKLVASLLFAAILTAAGGCLITSGSSVTESGTRVSGATLGQIEPGVTTEAWLLATLGEPTQRTVVQGAEHVAVLRYDHVQCRKDGGTVFLLLAVGSRERTVSHTYFEVVDGVVTRHWREPA
jgi:hypothetical protein